MKKLFNYLVIAALAFSFQSCGGNSADNAEHSHSHDTQTVQEDSNESMDDAVSSDDANYAYTAAYVCPMHCEGSGSEEAGKCPVCNMDYVANNSEESMDDAEVEHHDHEGHEH